MNTQVEMEGRESRSPALHAGGGPAFSCSFAGTLVSELLEKASFEVLPSPFFFPFFFFFRFLFLFYLFIYSWMWGRAGTNGGQGKRVAGWFFTAFDGCSPFEQWTCV